MPIASALDRAVVRLHRLSFSGRYHPYFFFTDLAMVAVAILAVVYARFGSGFSLHAFFGAFVVMQIVYLGFLQIKARVFGIASRSFLQDTLIVLLPTYALSSLAFGNSLRASLDFAGLALPLGLSFIRIGCFAGGCCYGVPVAWGVLYPEALQHSVAGCRNFHPGPRTQTRVLPMQLGDAACNAALFATLAWWTFTHAASRGRVLPFYLAGYSSWRLFSDFWRRSSARPTRAGLSEAQWVSLALLAGVGIFLWVTCG